MWKCLKVYCVNSKYHFSYLGLRRFRGSTIKIVLWTWKGRNLQFNPRMDMSMHRVHLKMVSHTLPTITPLLPSHHPNAISASATILIITFARTLPHHLLLPAFSISATASRILTTTRPKTLLLHSHHHYLIHVINHLHHHLSTLPFLLPSSCCYYHFIMRWH